MMKITQKIVGFLGAIALAVSASLMASTVANAADIGTTWSNATTQPNISGLDSIAYGDGVFVGVNADGDILRSTDGKSWTTVELTGVTWSSSSFGGGVFVILGDDGNGPVFRRSTDNGVSFSAAASTSNLSSLGYTGLSYGQGKFIALDNRQNCSVALSTDAGATWSDGQGSDSCDEYQSSAFGNNTFVSISNTPSVEFTTDPSSVRWDPVTFGNSVYPLNGDTPSNVAFNGSEFMFLLYGANGDVYKYSSPDGEQWPDGVLTSGLPITEYSGLGWDGSAWLAGAGGSGTGIYRSVDGVSWTQVDANNTQWSAFALGSNIMVAGGLPQMSTGQQGLNTTIAIGWSVPTVAPPVEPTVTPSPVTPAELANTGLNSLSIGVSEAVALAMFGLGFFTLRRLRGAK